MIRTLLTTTALAALLTTGALAQATTTTPVDPNAPATTATDGSMMQPFDLSTGYMAADTDDLASRIIGTPVYSSAASDAEHFGEVNDLVLGDDGSIRAAIIGVGGFLGIGEKNVAVDFSQLTMVVAEDSTERWVLEATREQLEAAPAFEFIEDDVDSMGAAPADGAMTPATDSAATPAETTTMAPADGAMAPATDSAAAPVDSTTTPADGAMAPATDNAMAPADPAAPMTFDRTTMTPVDRAALTAEELIGTGVVGPDNDQIASVGDLVLTEDGQVDAVLVDFGGFLGIGQKRVAVGMDNLEFLTDESGNRYVFLSTITREQLEAAPDYDPDTYATDPNQRLTLGAM